MRLPLLCTREVLPSAGNGYYFRSGGGILRFRAGNGYYFRSGGGILRFCAGNGCYFRSGRGICRREVEFVGE